MCPDVRFLVQSEDHLRFVITLRITFRRIIGVWLVLSFGAIPYAFAQAHTADREGAGAVQTQMRNVMYHYTDSLAVLIKSLDGELLPVDPTAYPVFDNKESFRLRADHAEITIDAPDLCNIFNTYVFSRANTPVTGVSLGIENGKLKIRGKLHQVGVIPFETEGTLWPTPDGRILLHVGKIKAMHVPVTGILNLFGVDVADLIKTGKIPGVQSSGDDLILDPALLLPPPHLEGKVTAVRIEGQSVLLTFGDRNHVEKSLQVGNYMSYRGNKLGFGKLTMTDSDMFLIDMDPADPLDFFLDRYKAQLAAGYTKITPRFGLRVYIRDFNKLGKAAGKKNLPAAKN
jgi:hypothetical protein